MERLDPSSSNDIRDNSQRPRSASIQSSRSWPLLPVLQVTTTNGSNNNAVLENHHSDKMNTKTEENNDKDDSFSSIDSESDAASEYDVFEEVKDIPIRHSGNRNMSGIRTSSVKSKRRDSTGTLVEAALDQVEARERHVRFGEHIAEAGNLVQRMLSTRIGGDTGTSNRIYHRHDDIEEYPECHRSGSIEESASYQQPITNTGGSVLASLLKLENQRRLAMLTKKNPVKRKKSSKKRQKNKKQKPASMYNFKVYDSSDAVNPSIQAIKRPDLVHRPTSWLSTLTTSNHLVPSLQKRKMTSAVSMSRRSSIDSMFTTASQFEPITLEDRIRITFEIANILQKQEFLRKLVKALMLYGAPAHRLEYILRQVSRTLGVDAEYVYIPNVMFLTFFDQSTHTTETHFIRSSQLFDMHKLGEIFRLEKLVSHGEVSVDEALEFIDKVANEPPFYPVWLNPFIYALASFCGCVMFYGGQFKEGGLSAALAIFFAIYELFTGRYLSFQPIWEITVCIFIGFVSRAVWRYEFCFTPVAFASFIIILPGYSMAVSIIELVSRQLVSGVVRMVYAIIYSFLLGYGIEMGSELFGTIDPESVSQQGVAAACVAANSSNTCRTIISKWFYFLTVPLFAIAYCIYLGARPPRWPVMVFVAVAGFVTTYVLACYTSAPSQVLQVVPAFVVGLLGNILSKLTGKMSLDAVILGVFYMVPGSLGLKAALGFFGQSGTGEFANQGAGFALSMIETSIGISVGLFVATLIVYPKGTQHTPLMSF
ncbi:hypothetical protein G6F49_000160 [Rhizopus delemar]|nr:hypothetical protein G6F49_000160 [Rhizopus delemar]